MPRSFLVKKKDDPRTYHSYKPRDHVDTSDITPESLLALTPYTPSFLPLTVRVNNGKKNTHVYEPAHNKAISNSYTLGCPHVRGDNPRALASGLSYVQVDKHGITILYHLHQCRPCTSSDVSC